MAHRDGATGAADTVDPQGAASDGAGEDAGTAQAPQESPADGEQVTDDAAAPADADEAATPTEAAAPAEGESASGRKPRLPRPSSGRTPAFGLSLGAIRQRSAAGDGTAELRRNLADKEAQTNELREALDALRQALDDTTPPRVPDAPAVAPRRRRPLLLLLAALAAVAVVVAVVLAVQGSGGSGTVAAPSGSPTASSSAPVASSSPSAAVSSPVASSAPATSSAPAGPAVKTTPMPWRGDTLLTPPGAATSGPGVDAPGTDVTVAIDADLKHVDVFERAVFTTPQSALTLALPPASVWSTALPEAKPVVTDLQVVLDGTPVKAQQTAAGWYALPPGGSTVTRVELRYQVSGTVVDLQPSPSPMRRLIGVPTFTGQTSLDASASIHVTVDDPRVLGVTCLQATSGSVPCSSLGDGLAADVAPGDSPFVVLQADLVPLG